MWAAIKAVIEYANKEQSILIALAIGLIALLYSHFHVWIAYRGRLADKNVHIKDLIEERNKLQDFVLKQKGRKRLTSDEDKS